MVVNRVKQLMLKSNIIRKSHIRKQPKISNLKEVSLLLTR